MNTKALRQKILDLAIHGKLVPQDPNDEPASVLLERIRAEKERLIKEGKIKKPKKSKATCDKPHYENEEPFNLPNSWIWCTLGELCNFLSRGKSPKYLDEDRTYPVFAQKCNLKDGGISLEQARFLDPATVNKWSEEYKLRTGDVLVNSTGTGTVGRTRLFNENCLGQYPFVVPDSHVSVIRTFDEISSEFVYAYLSSNIIQEYLADNLAGSTNQKELYIGVLERLPFPLPSYREQQRIVSKINEWHCSIENIEQDKTTLIDIVKLAKSKILDLAIHGKLVPQDPNDEPAAELLKRINPKAEITCDNPQYGKLPKGWCLTTFKGAFKDISSKPFQILQSQIKIKGKHPVISQSSNFIEGYSDEDVLYKCDTPIIIFGDHTRNVKYVDFDFIVGADGVKIIKPYLDAKYGYFLILYAASHIVNKGYSRHFSQISKFDYIVPPLKEQHRIVKKIEELFAQLEQIETSL